MVAMEQLIKDVRRLPIHAIPTVREFVLFEIKRSGSDVEIAEDDTTKRNDAFERLLKYSGRITREIDIEKEKMEALIEKHCID